MRQKTTGTGLTFNLPHIIALLLFFMFLPACAGLSPEKNGGAAQMQARMDENSRKLDELHHRMSVIQFMVDSHEKSLRELEAPLQTAQTARPVPVVEAELRQPRNTDASAADAAAMIAEGPETVYGKALQAYNAQNYDRAIELCSLFVRKYPSHDLADNALYWIGESLYSQKEYQGAIDHFKKLVDTYPNGGKVPDALLKTGYSYYSLKDFENARIYLKKVIVNYPFSPAGSKAEEMLERIK